MSETAGPKVQRRLAAILAADVVGYSRLMGQDEAGTLARIKSLRAEVIEPQVKEHGGRVFKTTGDGFLVEFPSPVEAVECAVGIQEAQRAKAAQEPSQALQIRIGINLGDLIVEADGDIFGDGVNIAARVEQVAEPGGILISGKVYEEVRDKLQYTFEDRGERQIKNIERPVRLYRLVSREPQPGARPEPHPRLELSVPRKPSLAVLPFSNLSGDEKQEYFADAIAEEVTTALGRLRGFFVIARNSAFAYKEKPVPAQQVGRDLGVRYILEGSVQRSGERVRVGVRLTESDTGREVWSERFDKPLLDVFALQDEIAASVVVAIEPRLYAAERDRIQQKAPDRLDAWDCVIRALSFMWKQTRRDNETALELLSNALRLDPTYPRALGLHAWLSLWLVHHTGWSNSNLSAVLPGALDRARSAVEGDGDDAWPRLALGFALMFNRDSDAAVEELRTALEVNPNFALAHACLALALAYAGRGAEAVGQIETAMRLSPRDPFVSMFSGVRAFSLFMAGEYSAGLEWSRRAVRQSPDLPGHWRALALSAAMLGLHDEASQAIATAIRLQPGYSVAWVETSSPLVHSEDRARYCELLRAVGLPE